MSNLERLELSDLDLATVAGGLDKGGGEESEEGGEDNGGEGDDENGNGNGNGNGY